MKMTDSLLHKYMSLKKKASKLEKEIEQIRQVLLDNDGFESGGFIVEVQHVARQFAASPAKIIEMLGEKDALKMELIENRRIKTVRIINSPFEKATAA